MKTLRQPLCQLLWLAPLGAILGIAACGGGSSSSSMAPSGMPTQAVSASSGVLTAFGSVIVNGTEFVTGNSTSVLDGDNDDAGSSMAALQVGMTVDVAASGQTANWVRYTSAVRGEVDAVAGDGSSITVLGQTVLITSATSFAGSNKVGPITGDTGTSGNVLVGDYVTVFGFLQCTSATSSSTTPCTSAEVVASLVYGSATPGIYRVEGYAQVGSGSDSFTINGLTVDYASSGSMATVCSTAPCSIANGAFVAVRSATAPTTGPLTLTATSIRTTTQIPVYTAGATVSVEGPLTGLDASVMTFDVRGASVDYSGIAASVAALANGQIVEVTGTIASNGTIMATAITVERQSTFALMAPLDGTPAPTTTSLSVLGQTFNVTSTTRFVDWSKGVRPFNSSNFSTVLSPGDQLVVSGYATSSGDVATRVERLPTPPIPLVSAQGIVTADAGTASTDTVAIAGVTATLGSSTIIWYRGAAGSPTLAGFLGAITLNSTVVIVFGTASGPGAISASDAVAMPGGILWALGPF